MADYSGGSSSSSSGNGARGANSSLNDQISPTRRRSGKNELDARSDGGGKALPAWKLREQMKQNVSSHPSRTIRPVTTRGGDGRGLGNDTSLGGGLGSTSHSLSRSRNTIDPSLPPAFRAAFSRQQQRKHKDDIDDFMSLDSVHSGKNSIVTGTPTTANNDSDGSIGSESFDGHDSFASLGENSDDDEAYRESKNQLRRQEIEGQDKTSHRNGLAGGGGTKRGSDYRFKKVAKGVHGTPLGFIPE